jgi:formate-dependent nitrite reductase membrane component NrfD
VEVPAYFFVGGVAGVAAVIATVGALAGVDPTLVRDARWVAAAGALISPALLVSDLGRPERFLNMMRVFKTRSPMSVGAWTLAVFTPAVLAALVWGTGAGEAPASFWVRFLGDTAGLVAAGTGLVLATYTGVLLAVTAIPVWAAHARVLPVHFGASSLGAAVSVLELLGHRTPAMNALGIAAAAAVSATWWDLEWIAAASAPLRSGASGRLIRAADLRGVLPPARPSGRSPPARIAAAVL